MIEKGNMTDAEYIAALIAENLATRSDMKKLERENRMLTEKNRHLGFILRVSERYHSAALISKLPTRKKFPWNVTNDNKL